MKIIHIIAFILLVIGGLNWGLVGLFDWNLVESILKEGSGITNIVYVLVGISAIYLLITHPKECKTCASSGQSGPTSM